MARLISGYRAHKVRCSAETRPLPDLRASKVEGGYLDDMGWVCRFVQVCASRHSVVEAAPPRAAAGYTHAVRQRTLIAHPAPTCNAYRDSSSLTRRPKRRRRFSVSPLTSWGVRISVTLTLGTT